MMRIQGWIGVFSMGLWLLVGELPAQPPSLFPEHNSQAAPTRISPLHDDANLHAVQFVGTKYGWMVGDHGVIRATRDGGNTWDLQKSPVTCPLKSVCFLTDKIGWIVGGAAIPYTRVPYGVVLSTEDGGTTWKKISENQLPPLRYVKFFGPREGVAVGDATPEYPTGILITDNGGKTWTSVQGETQTGWNTAGFFTPQAGVVAGHHHQYALVAENRLMPRRFEQNSNRHLRAIALQYEAPCWMVGDGGMVQFSVNRGLVWQDPPTPLPQELIDTTDFQAVAAKGNHVWIAGSPGSVIWHSADHGRNWEPQRTPQTVPISSLYFVSETVGWAVGALGSVLQTTDGGRTWKAVRGAERHVALMSVHSRPEQICFPLFAQQSAELGYRSLVLLPVSREAGPGAQREAAWESLLHQSVITAGGSGAVVDWRFPVNIPDLDFDQEKLLAHWNRITEGRFTQAFLSKLVCQIRTWRPHVIVLDEPAPNDETTRLINQAILEAVRQAADPHRSPAFDAATGLPAWEVKKIYYRLAPGGTGHTHIEPYQLLHRLGSSVTAQAAPGASLLNEIQQLRTEREAFRLASGSHSQYVADFFLGLSLLPDSPTRRALLPLNEELAAQQEKLLQRQKHFRGYVERYLDDPRQSAQLIGQLRMVLQGLEAEQAAFQMLQLAQDYRAHSQWSLYEATLVELAEQYPRQPASREAMKQLFHLWTSSEVIWQRMKGLQTGRGQLAVDPQTISNRIEQAIYQSMTPEQRREQPANLGPDPVNLVQKAGGLKVGENRLHNVEIVKNWHNQAIRLASLLRNDSPELYRSPEIQFPLSAILRQRGNISIADQFYQRYLLSSEDNPWKKTAHSEIWLSLPQHVAPKQIVTCAPAAAPHLDGILSDPCWLKAEELRLQNPSSNDITPAGWAMVAYDREFLYLAVSIPRAQGVRTDGPDPYNREYDADLTGFDRVRLSIDVDRDYASAYTFEIDQRGWTRESCWGDQSWNPKWFVAAEGNETHWRIEAAIPFAELGPSPPLKHQVWAVGFQRLIPGVGVQSWTQPVEQQIRPELFGLLKFD